jgi:PAS domain S-box-containing protein
MKKISIREKLILYFVVLSVISITIVSLFSIFEAKKGITDRTFSQLILLRDLRREQILTFFESRTRELNSLACSQEIIEMAVSIKNNAGITDNEAIIFDNRHLPYFFDDSSYFKSSYFISAEGDIYKYLPMDSGFEMTPEPGLIISDTGFLDGLNNMWAKTTYQVFEQILPQKTVQTLIAVPVVSNEDDYCGALLSEIYPEAVYNIIYDKFPGTGMGKTGEAYLVGTDGMMRSPSRFIQGAVLNIPVRTTGFLRAMEGKEGVGIYNDYRGVEILGAYGLLDIGGLNRIILAEIDFSEAMVPLAAIRNEILFLSLIIVLVIFGLAMFVAHGITRPLVRLKNAANFIAQGNYNQQLEIKENDEIGELTQAFNAMALEIKSTTRELKENEERLRHFYAATLDGIILHENERMLLFNAAMLVLTGYTGSEMSEFRLTDILQERKSTDCSRDSAPRTYESLLIRKDGSNLAVEVQESCVEYEGKNVRASVIRDISARKKMEAELADERNKRVRAVFDGQDHERQRLSRELHDGLGQQLAAGKLILESSLYTSDADELKPKIGEAQRIFDQIIGDIRRISHDLSPSILQEFGLKSAMENLCNEFRKTTGMQVDFLTDLKEGGPDEMTSTYLFRIAQEGLINIQRHSGATRVKVALTMDNYGIFLEIKDNGQGFQVKEVLKKGGNGLYNMRERAGILKGNLTIKSHPGKGAVILVRVPVRDV